MAPSDDEKSDPFERFRQTGLRLDRDGRWWHEGGRVEHAGMARAFSRWVDRLDDGRYVLRLDEKRYAYVEVEDAPLVARSARVEGVGVRVWLSLSDETEEALDPATLARRGGQLYCRARGGRLPCRLAPQAVYALGDALREEEGGVVLEIGGKRYAIADE
ncbi:MAG: DUF1285 domain-containing protein [Myxococcota bacterium]